MFPTPSTTGTQSEVYSKILDDTNGWNLENEADIVSVYLVLRNIDRYTEGRFKRRIHSGLVSLVQDVERKGKMYQPWKRKNSEVHQRQARTGRLLPSVSAASDSTTPSPVPAKATTVIPARRLARTSKKQLLDISAASDSPTPSHVPVKSTAKTRLGRGKKK